ncbi:hypothetical protein [Sinosporangium siamense]|uniref:Uncharacterized protein n=1 Tax=Sinosporangium siamense TaxID=1367973 RepID=A0A919RC24_9ACTN|nr:hypothetical protein [Sinosporangium siamense]GII90020.1 hypothetical protein Ssi02_02510 [Sinosporangium siamense]
MRFSFASRRMPAPVRKALSLEPGERVLTHTKSGEDGYLVATDRALLLPGGTRVPWHLIDRASWDEEGLRVIPTQGPARQVPVAEPGRMPEVVRERVTASIVVSRYVTLARDGGVRIVARRVPGSSDLLWEFAFDSGMDPDDPGLRALAEQALEGVRRTMGV